MRRYTPLRVHIQPNQENRFKRAIQKRTRTIVRFALAASPSQNNGILCLTHQQMLKVQKAPCGTPFQFTFSAAQIKANLQHEGGFLPLLLAALAPILGGVVGGIAERAIAGGSGLHDDVLWKRKKRIFRLTSHGDGLFLAPYSSSRIPTRYGSGLFLTPPPSSRGYGIMRKMGRRRLPTDHPLHSFPLTIFM